MQLLLSGGIAVFRSHFLMTNSVIIKGRDCIMLADPAFYPDEVELLGEVVTRAKKPNTYCLYTHFDYDHVVDPPQLKAFRIASEHVAERDLDQDLGQWQQTDAQMYIERTERRYPVPDHLASEREEAMELAGEELVIVKAPGHTIDSLIYVLPQRRVAMVGDMLSDKEFPFIGYSLSEYQHSLLAFRRLAKEYDVELVIPGHGNVATGKQIFERLETDLSYLDDIAAVGDSAIEGNTSEELEELGRRVTYNGQPIPPWQRQEHLRNIQMAVQTAGRNTTEGSLHNG